jgi:ABC-type uncharacterized transport system permease subunit
MPDLIIASVMTMMTAATPLMFAATGELICERSGVLNLGVEGMMLIGAVFGFATAAVTGNAPLGLLMAGVAGLLASLIFAALTLSLLSNQVATGLALTIFGTGLSALVGFDYVGETIDQIAAIHLPVLSDLPVVGRLLFGHDPLVYLSLGLLAAVAWFLSHSRWGMILRAVGDSDVSAHRISRGVDPLCRCGLWRIDGGPGRWLPVAGVYAAVGGEYGGRAWLDCSCPGCFCQLAT